MTYRFFNYSTGELVESTSYGWRRYSPFFCEGEDFRFLGRGEYLASWTCHPVGRRRVNFQRGYRAVR